MMLNATSYNVNGILWDAMLQPTIKLPFAGADLSAVLTMGGDLRLKAGKASAIVRRYVAAAQLDQVRIFDSALQEIDMALVLMRASTQLVEE